MTEWPSVTPHNPTGGAERSSGQSQVGDAIRAMQIQWRSSEVHDSCVTFLSVVGEPLVVGQ